MQPSTVSKTSTSWLDRAVTSKNKVDGSCLPFVLFCCLPFNQARVDETLISANTVHTDLRNIASLFPRVTFGAIIEPRGEVVSTIDTTTSSSSSSSTSSKFSTEMSGRILPVIPPLMRAVVSHVQSSMSIDVYAPAVHIKGSRTIFSIYQYVVPSRSGGVVVVIVSEPGGSGTGGGQTVSGFDTAAADAIVLPLLPKLQDHVSTMLRLIETS